MNHAAQSEKLAQLRIQHSALASLSSAPPISGVITTTAVWMVHLEKILTRATEVSSSLGPESIEAIDSYLDEVLDQLLNLAIRTGEAARAHGVASGETIRLTQELRRQADERIERSVDKYRLPITLLLDAAHVSATRDGSIPVAQLEQAATDYKALSGQLTAALGSLKVASENAAAGQAIGDFASRATAHQRAAIAWGALTAIAGALTVKSVYFVLDLSPKSDATREIATYVLHSVLVVALATVALRIAIRRWNLERNLQIIYKHRVAGLKQYLILRESIPAEQVESRDQLLLTSVQMLLQDPVTGYRDDSSSDVTVLPIAALADRVSAAAKK